MQQYSFQNSAVFCQTTMHCNSKESYEQECCAGFKCSRVELWSCVSEVQSRCLNCGVERVKLSMFLVCGVEWSQVLPALTPLSVISCNALLLAYAAIHWIMCVLQLTIFNTPTLHFMDSDFEKTATRFLKLTFHPPLLTATSHPKAK